MNLIFHWMARTKGLCCHRSLRDKRLTKIGLFPHRDQIMFGGIAIILVSLLAFAAYKFLFKSDCKQLPKFSGKRDIPPLLQWAQEAPSTDSRKFIKCTNPGNGEVLCEPLPAMTFEEVKERILAARKVQKEVWSKTSFEERKRVLSRLSEAILNNKDRITAATSLDSGKTLVESTLGEILTTCEKIRWVVKYGESFLQPESRSVPLFMFMKKAYVEYHPVGVVGTIIPWNYPFNNIVGPMIAALMAGNAFITKVSEWTTWSTVYCFEKLIHDVLIECGYSPDLCQFVIGFGDSGESLIRAGADHVLFIGSPETGKKVMRAASDSLTPITLELGGKDPFIVCDDADLNQVLAVAMNAIFINCGQNCVAAERFYVQESIYHKFIDEVVKRAKNIRQGPTKCSVDGNNKPLAEVYDVGAMTMGQQMVKLEELIADAIKNGAKVVLGGKQNHNRECEKGQFFEPTILIDVTQDMRICKEEAFGPVMLIAKWETDEEVLEKANSSEFGLGSYVFSTNLDRAHKMVQNLQAGVCMVNDWGVFYTIQDIPFGGVKKSGFGRFNAREGLRAFCHQRSVVTDRFSFWRLTPPAFLLYPLSSVSHLIAWSGLEFVYRASWKDRLYSLMRMMKLLISKK